VELVVVLALSAHLAVAAQAESSRPLAHLEAAGRVLDGMSSAALSGDVRDAVDDLRMQLSVLAETYRRNPEPFVPAESRRGRNASPGADALSNWKPAFSAIEHELGRLLAENSSDDEITPAIREQLEQFRLELELFFAAATLGIENETAIGASPRRQTSSG
jgi:hypothetical protein